MKKKTVIAIWGPPKIGKSSSIKTIVEQFKTIFPTADVEILINGMDVRAIVTIDKIKIGIESAGDPGSRLPQSLALFEREKCSIIICATRSRGSTVEVVEALHTNHNFDIMWTAVYSSQEKPIALSNVYFAKHILFLVGEILAGRY